MDAKPPVLDASPAPRKGEAPRRGDRKPSPNGDRKPSPLGDRKTLLEEALEPRPVGRIPRSRSRSSSLGLRLSPGSQLARRDVRDEAKMGLSPWSREAREASTLLGCRAAEIAVRALAVSELLEAELGQVKEEAWTLVPTRFPKRPGEAPLCSRASWLASLLDDRCSAKESRKPSGPGLCEKGPGERNPRSSSVALPLRGGVSQRPWAARLGAKGASTFCSKA